MSRIIKLNLPKTYNASEVLFHNLEAGRGDRVALHYREQQISYAQLAKQADRVGAGLRALGLAPASACCSCCWTHRRFRPASLAPSRPGLSR